MPAGSSFLIKEGMLSNKIDIVKLDNESFYSIGVRNQLLHAVHPLGWFCEINLAVDGKYIPKEDIFFELRGQWINFTHIHTIKDVYWYIMEEARFNFRVQPELVSGAHNIECEFVASTLEVATQMDLAEKWPRRNQKIIQTAFL